MKRESYNQGWLFSKDGHESEAVTVNLPHDAMLYEKRSKEAPSGNGCAFFEGGKYVYTKRWFAGKEYQDKLIWLEFDGVYRNAQVFVNEKPVYERPYGYSLFRVSIGDYLRFGEENEIKVIADNSQQPNSRWYSGSGIYREVHMLVAGKSHILPDGIRVTTVSLDPPTVNVRVETENCRSDEILIQIVKDGQVAAEGMGADRTMTVPGAELWDEEHPTLYVCRVCIRKEGKTVDEEQVPFGIRMIQCSPKGLYVNGKETLLKGACIHHDNGILGACAFRDAEFRKVRLLKEAGFNAIRASHNPVSQGLLDACDQFGMYLIDESFDQWTTPKSKFDYAHIFDKWWRTDTLDMVRKDYNHPSVIAYSIGNEIPDTASREGISLTRQMRELIRSADETRPVMMAVSLLLNAMVTMGIGMYNEDKSASGGLDSLSGSAFANFAMTAYGKFSKLMAKSPMADKGTKDAFEQVDICGYNYGEGRYDRDVKKYPSRVIVGSETLPPDVYHNWQKVKKYPAIIGDFVWTGWDYLGESGIACVQYESWSKQKENPPLLLGGAGIIDITGMFRPEVWLNRAAYGYNDPPYIGVEPVIYAKERAISSPWRDTDAVNSWSWQGCEGSVAKVRVYSGAEEVELLLNGKRVGWKRVKACKAQFEVTYEPGELTAVAYVKGKETGRSSLKTAGSETYLSVRAEKRQLRANGQDLAYVNIALTDAQGIVQSMDNRKITVMVEGAGSLAGFGTADPHTSESFIGNIRSAYYGRAQAVIRTGAEKGAIRVTVKADGLEPVVVEIRVTEE